MEAWLPHRSVYLDELLRFQGLGEWSSPPTCAGCESAGTFRCTCCCGNCMTCRVCTVTLHAYQPLHIIEVGDIL